MQQRPEPTYQLLLAKNQLLLKYYQDLSELDSTDAELDFELARTILHKFAIYGLGDKEIADQLMQKFVGPFKLDGGNRMFISEEDNPGPEEKVNRRLLASILYNSETAILRVSSLNEETVDATGLPDEIKKGLMLFKEYYKSLVPAAQLKVDMSKDYIGFLSMLRANITKAILLEESSAKFCSDLYDRADRIMGYIYADHYQLLKRLHSGDESSNELKNITLAEILNFIRFISMPGRSLSADEIRKCGKDQYVERFFELYANINAYIDGPKSPAFNLTMNSKVYNICAQYCAKEDVEDKYHPSNNLREMVRDYIKPFMDEKFPGVLGM